MHASLPESPRGPKSNGVQVDLIHVRVTHCKQDFSVNRPQCATATMTPSDGSDSVREPQSLVLDPSIS